MLSEMRPSEMGRWFALMQVEPWGSLRDDLRAGYVAASLAPAWLKKTGGVEFTASDFMPEFGREPEPAAPKKKNPVLRAFLDGMSARSAKP